MTVEVRCVRCGGTFEIELEAVVGATCPGCGRSMMKGAKLRSEGSTASARWQRKRMEKKRQERVEDKTRY